MFIGHYGPAFGLKTLCKPVPLWVLFIAVQWLDVVWSVLVFAGVEKLRIVPGFTQGSALDLYYMPYTHGLGGALALSLLLGAIVAACMGAGAATAMGCPPEANDLITPTTSVIESVPTKRYVGIAKAVPASRTPRRLRMVMTTRIPTQRTTVCGSKEGTAETKAPTPAEIPTAAVRI